MSYYQSKKFRNKHTKLQKQQKHKVQLQDSEEDHSYRQARKRKDGPSYLVNSKIHLILVFHISGDKTRDIDGMVSTVFDSLVRAGVIKDDNLGIIPSFTANFTRVEPGNEGVDIILLEKE